MPQADYKLVLDDSQVKERLRDVNGRFVKMGQTGDEAMKKVGKSSVNLSNIMNGAMAGAFTTLTGLALKFGQVAVSAFANVLKSSTQAAMNFDVTKRKFTSIFEGQEDQAEAVMDHIGKRASALGLELNEALSLSRAFLPDVRGTEDPLGHISDLLVGVRAMAEEDPAQGIIGARFAIDEAMSGSLRSLRARFEFTKAEIDILKAAQQDLGQVVGTIEGINAVMKRRGVDVEALKGTFTQAMGEMTFATSKLQIALGKPIADQLTESLGDLNKLVSENSDDLQMLAGSVGDVVANVIDFISTDVVEWLAGIDVGNIQEVVDAFNRMVTQIRVINDLLPGMEMNGGFLDDVKWVIDKVTEAVEVFNKLNSIIKIMGESGKGLGGAVIGAFKEEGGTFGERFTKSLITIVKGNEEVEKSFLASAEAIEKGNQRMKEQEKTIKDREVALDSDTSATLKSAEAFLKEADAASKAQSELEKLGLTEKQISKLHKDAANVLERRNTLETKFSQERADNHRQALDDIADIEADYRQDVTAAGVDLNRSTRNMATKHGQERADVETGLRRQLLDIELSYQQEMERIARDTKLSLESAELSQDAIAFVEALRQQEVAEEEAAVRRDEGEQDAQLTYEQQLIDLKESQIAERATLQQSQQDKLADLQLSLEQELAEQRLASDRQAEQQAINEQRQLDTLNQGYMNKLDKLTEGLDAETAAVVRAEAAKLIAVESFAKQAEAKINQLVTNVSKMQTDRSPRPISGRPRRGGVREDAGLGAGGRARTPADEAAQRRRQEFQRRLAIANERRRASAGLPRRLGGSVTAGVSYLVGEVGVEGYLPRRQFGGRGLTGQPTLVGELGEELFVPPTSGNIIPNDQIGQYLGAGGVTNNNSTEINYQPRFELSNPAVLSPEQATQTQAIAVSVASQMFQQVLGGNK